MNINVALLKKDGQLERLDRPLVVGLITDKRCLLAVSSWKLNSACDWVGNHNRN